MPVIKSIALFVLIFCSVSGIAQQPSFVQTPTGVLIHPDLRLSGNVKTIRLEVITSDIIRVLASPDQEIAPVKSLITVYAPKPVPFTTGKNAGKLLLKTDRLTVAVDLSSGAMSFADKAGKILLAESRNNGRNISPAIFEGKPSYSLLQKFEMNAGDAYYGLGQHQSDHFNYKGQQVFLFQNNTEVAVPFLISKNNYGILWDNYSLTKVGDTRPYLPLNALRLTSKNGEYGWLTASYNNDKSKPGQTDFTRAESGIDYPWLNDTKRLLPENFKPASGRISWEGDIASGKAGMHKLQFTYAGSVKVWVSDSLILDRWRQAWNPSTVVLDLPMDKDKKYPFRIEWTPDGTESYFDVKCQVPVPAAEENIFAFASEAGQQLDYYFVSGRNMDEVISGYRHLTGKATIVPKWAMGFWQSRERYKTQAELMETVAEFRKRKIPLDNIVQDWSYWKEDDWGSQEFDKSRFPSPDSMIAKLHRDYNTKFMISVWPKFYEGIDAYKKFDSKGWLYKRNIADRQRDWIAKGYISTFYDAFNNDARKGFWDLLNEKLYKKGVDAWWMDASEPDILSNVSPEQRKLQMAPTALGPAAEYLNAYPLENAKGIYQGQRSVDPDKRVFLLTRSGFAGSQHYAATIWSGDISSTWGDMRSQISAGINFSLSGIPFWTMDIGGFASHPKYEKPNAEDLEEWREMQTRWFQFGCFVPLFRSHGQFPFREMFHVAPDEHPAYKSMLFYDQLRYRLMPYVYTLAAKTYHDDYTIMRGLVMDFPSDEKVKNIGHQYMFGPSLLISPVFNYKDRSKTLYLPAGQGWYDLYSGKYYTGGQEIKADAPYERMPVMVKEGSIIPTGPALQYSSQKAADTIRLFVYTGNDAAFSLYEDEGVNYQYEKGAFANIPVVYNEKLKQLTIGDRKGNFPGMLTKRTFKVIFIKPSSPSSFDPDREGDETVNYSGQKIIVSADKSSSR